MIRSLSGVSPAEIHDAFLDAFSTYEVRSDVSLSQLSDMMRDRSCSLDRSLGYFDGDRLVGFLLTGYREREGKRSLYDVATGIRQAYQSRGIGKELLGAALREMRDAGIDRFALEVLENNLAARKLYEGHGFAVSRKLRCYRADLAAAGYANTLGLTARDVPIADFPALARGASRNGSLGFTPSWQNANESVLAAGDGVRAVEFLAGQKRAGYAAFAAASGNILQLALEPGFRDGAALGSALAALRSERGLESVKLLNIEEGSATDALLWGLGFENFVNQFEMIYENPRTTR